MAIDNLAQANAEIEKLWKRLERVERGAPVGFTAVSRGALRIVSAEGLIVEGSARISGTLTGNGQMNWSGGITFTGPFNINGVTTQNGAYTVNGAWKLAGNGIISGNVNMTGLFDLTGDANLSGTVTVTGPMNISGVVTITGPLTVSGTLGIKGVTTLENNIIVKSNGKLTIEGARAMTVGMSSSGFPGVEFPTGLLTSSASGMSLSSGAGNGLLGLSSAIANLSLGSCGVSTNGSEVNVLGPLVTSAGLTLTNLPTMPATGRTPNLWQDPSSKIVYRLV